MISWKPVKDDLNILRAIYRGEDLKEGILIVWDERFESFYNGNFGKVEKRNLQRTLDEAREWWY